MDAYIQLIIAAVAFIAWLARLESRINHIDEGYKGKDQVLQKELDRNEKMVDDLISKRFVQDEKLTEAINNLNHNVTVMMGEMKHMNRRVTNLETGKMGPIIQEYLDRES